MQLTAVVFLLVGVTFSASAQAEIRRIVVDRQEPMVDDAAAGLPAYEKLRGRLFGEVDPSAPENSIIQDIELAPRNSRDRVEYISTFTLLRPVAVEDSNKVLIAELPNRGHRPAPFGSADRNELMFLRSRGYSVLWVGWQGDLTEKPSAALSAESLKFESIDVPRVRQSTGAPITGLYLIRVPTYAGSGPNGQIMRLEQGGAGPLSYFPASYDTRQATLTGGEAEGMDGRSLSPRYALAPSDWTWWNCSSGAPAHTAVSPAELCVKRLKGSFRTNESYTLVFTVRDPIVLGLGMAAIRDAVSFFRGATADSTGTPNPLAMRIKHVIGQGISQAGNLVKTFIALGFNADEQGRRVWDGANAHIAGRRIPLNYRFATPGSSATLHMPGNEGALWWGRASGAAHCDKSTTSLLDRCCATETCPRVFETFGGAELWNQRMTQGLVTLDLKRDIPLPHNVRRYFFPGTSHGGGSGGFSLDAAVLAERGPCTLPPNPNPQDAQMRALLIALTDWVTAGAEPPPSRYPTIAQGELVRDTPDALRAPALHAVPRPYGISNPLLVYDYGADFDYTDMSGVITRMPPLIRNVVPALVAQVDTDGNEMAGVPSVQLMAPLGSYLSWNTYRDGPYAGRICSSNGSFIPFAKTHADRLATGDERVSIEERYGSRGGYVAAIKRAAGQAVRERFLLPEDAARLIKEAEEATSNGDLSFLGSDGISGFDAPGARSVTNRK